MTAADPRAVAVARNALSGGGRIVVAAVLALAVTPYALGVLGQARFGVWALAGAVLAIVRLLDLGLNRAVTRAVAAAEGRDDRAAGGSALATARVLAVLVGAAATVAVWLAADVLVVRLLGIPPALRAEARFVIVGTAAVAALEGVFAPFQAALDGTGRMDLTNAVDTVQRVLSALGVVIVLAAGWGLAGLVWKNAATALLAGLAYRALLLRRAPELAHAAPRLDRRQARALLSFGRHVQAVNLGSVLIEPVCKGLLARVAGLEAVALYELAARVASQLAAAFVALATALFPAAAERTGDDRNLVALYRIASRYVAWLALPGYAVFFALAGPFAMAWLGPGYDEVGRAMAVLGAGWLVAILALPAFLVAQAGGRERLSTISAAVTVGVALGLAFLAVGPSGMMGVAAAVAIGLASGGVVALGLFARAHGLGWAVLDVGGPVPVAAALAGGMAALAAAGALPATLGGVVLAGTLGLAASAAVMWLGGAVGPADRALLAGLVRRS